MATRWRQRRWQVLVPLGVVLTASLSSGAVGVPEVEADSRSAPVVSLAEKGIDPHVVVDRKGTATVVWATHWRRGPIRAVRRPAGGEWGDPVTIGRGTSPLLATDDQGNLTVVFATNRRGTTTGQSAVRRSVTGGWGKPVHLTRDVPAPGYGTGDEGSFGAHRVDLEVSPGGSALVVWQWGSYDRGRPFRIEAVRRPAGGVWGKPVRLTRNNWSQWARAAINDHGRASAAYASPRGTLSRRWSAGGGWGPPVRVRGAGTMEGDLLLDSTGTETLTYTDYTEGRPVVRAARRARASRAWGPTRRVSPQGVYVWGEWSQTLLPSGAILVAVQRRSGRIDLVRRPPAGPWGAGTRVAPGDRENQQPTLATNRGGAVFVLWDHSTDGLTGRARYPGDGWTAPITVSPTDTYRPVYEAAVYPRGDLLAVWQSGNRGVEARRLSR